MVRAASRAVCLFVLLLLPCAPAGAQSVGNISQPAASPAPEEPTDPLGRTSPRGTVVKFLLAARKGDNALARHYLNTARDGRAAEELAHQLFLVLDARMPARLTEISDAPEGSRSNPLAPDRDVVGTVAGPDGDVDIVVERLERPKEAPIWLFSSRTLEDVPALYADLARQQGHLPIPRLLLQRRLGGGRLIDWIAVFGILPLFYVAMTVLNRILTPVILFIARRVSRKADLSGRNMLPAPARLLIATFASQWVFSALPLSLLAREFLSNVASTLTIIGVAWLLILLNGEGERFLWKRIPPANYSVAVSLVRVGRRAVDALIVLIAVLATLRHFGVDATPLVAGLGVGGIAVALAAQKTLENVIAGASLIFDQAVRVGDSLKMGDIEGTVEHIGLRSTRIRTMNRTIVSVPNSQIASVSLETLSARDKFWFHPIVGLRYDTRADQLCAVIDGIRGTLTRHRAIDANSVRVRFLRLGAFSLDIEVFAYVFARDWAHFLEIQEQLLFSVTEIVHHTGAAIALPSQTMYVTNTPSSLTPGNSVIN